MASRSRRGLLIAEDQSIDLKSLVLFRACFSQPIVIPLMPKSGNCLRNLKVLLNLSSSVVRAFSRKGSSCHPESSSQEGFCIGNALKPKFSKIPNKLTILLETAFALTETIGAQSMHLLNIFSEEIK